MVVATHRAPWVQDSSTTNPAFLLQILASRNGTEYVLYVYSMTAMTLVEFLWTTPDLFCTGYCIYRLQYTRVTEEGDLSTKDWEW